jgi:hypothetical protein
MLGTDIDDEDEPIHAYMFLHPARLHNREHGRPGCAEYGRRSG